MDNDDFILIEYISVWAADNRVVFKTPVRW